VADMKNEPKGQLIVGVVKQFDFVEVVAEPEGPDLPLLYSTRVGSECSADLFIGVNPFKSRVNRGAQSLP